MRVAVSDLSRSVLAEASAPHDVDHDAQGALDLAAELVERVLDEADVQRDRLLGVGIALAGPIDHDNGALHPSDVLPGWAGVDVADELERPPQTPAYVDNDANLGALAEVTLGAGRNASFAAYVSISSGIGAGIIVDGRPYRGHRGTAGEIGHVVVDPQGPICRCGNRGCLETLASGPALLRLVHASRDDELTVREMIELARDGDAGCRRAIADAGQVVGGVVAGLVNLFSPEMVVIGGDLGEAGDLLARPAAGGGAQGRATGGRGGPEGRGRRARRASQPARRARARADAVGARGGRSRRGERGGMRRRESQRNPHTGGEGRVKDENVLGAGGSRHPRHERHGRLWRR